MMKQRLTALTLAAAGTLPASFSHAALPADATDLSRRLAARFEGDRTGACVAAAVIDRDKVLRAQACAGTRSDGPPGENAAFEIGSVTKTMTAYLVADLIEQGRWSLDDPIARHLPAGTVLPRQGDRQILVRDLLTHTAGLPALPPGMRATNAANPYADLTEAELLKALADVKLTRPIGSRAEYSNFGMMLVSLAVANSHGGDLAAAWQRRLFEPLGMTATLGPDARRPQAQGHLPGGSPTPAWTITPRLAGVGMVRASLGDMVAYARAGLGDGPADVVARLRLTQQPLAQGFAMNWMHRELQGRALLLHEGGTGGFSSLIALDPQRHQAVVLLADTALTDLGGLGDLGLSLLGLDVPVQPPRRTEEAPAALRQALAGDYRLGPMRVRLWQTAEGRLMLQAQGQQAFELRYDSTGDFYPLGLNARLTPLPASTDAAVAGFTWHQGGGVVEATRVGTASTVASAPPADAKAWTGYYALTPQFSLRVFEQGGQWKVQGTGQPAITATAAGTDRLEITQVGAVVTFERNAAGEVVAAVLTQGGQVLRGARR
ncbi:class A beta-lactamase-related serine hydrolase [Pelomonas puraquae]|uniref:Beta-lactamase-related domain-containing protein n=1 Tax=Roseateles puraquae TaxID=431059 RepID=A0A254N6H4_9BURK|nr:class A beta-lactamase-related serine hydrolase [Roseateles puraquae]OWR03629.1 hypothetical protein CDO81_14165 [Roseateles puraquae]